MTVDAKSATPPTPSHADRQMPRAVAFALHHLWLRLALARVHIEWAQASLSDGFMTPEMALAILEDAIGEIVGEAA